VRTLGVGDVVVLPFQTSCGACAACLRGRTGNCESHRRLSIYGLGPIEGFQWGGLLADLGDGPNADAMLVKIPSSVSPVAVASARDNLSDAWRTVGPQLALDLGAEVLELGGDAGPKSIGLKYGGNRPCAGTVTSRLGR
jgi:D-arabinose 1-dehydrogenase-like Zn-dependent alcohol dehydrogenase